MARHDDIPSQLRDLHIPPPASNAVQRIMAEAHATPPRKQFAWLAALRQLRAWLYVPQVRYAIMTAAIVAFIALGAFSDSSPFKSREPQATQTAATQPAIAPQDIPDELVLYDVALLEDEAEFAALWAE